MPSEDPIIEQAQAAPVDPQTALCAALTKAQGEAANVTKNATADLGKRTYHYATLDTMRDALRPILASNGLAFVGRMAEGGILWHLSHVAGGTLEWLTGYPDGVNAPQGLGSAITYLTRYQLALLLGVAAEDDDDAQTAQEQAKAAPAAPRPAPTPPAQTDAAREDAMKAFWKAWAKSGLPSWQTDKDRAKVACDTMIERVLGERKYLSKLSVAELLRVNAALAPPPTSLVPPDEPDPFEDV